MLTASLITRPEIAFRTGLDLARLASSAVFTVFALPWLVPMFIVWGLGYGITALICGLRGR